MTLFWKAAFTDFVAVQRTYKLYWESNEPDHSDCTASLNMKRPYFVLDLVSYKIVNF